MICPQKQQLVKKLLAGRISLRGICRVVDISLTWLLKFIKQLYRQLPDDLNCRIPIKQVRQGDRFYIRLFDNEADELWSFVRKRDNVYYIWLVIHRATRQVIAFHVGDRSRKSARALWEKLPNKFKNTAYSTPMIGRVTKLSFHRDSTCTVSKSSTPTTWKGSIVPSVKDVLDS